jgi:hypothetical protein
MSKVLKPIFKSITMKNIKFTVLGISLVAVSLLAYGVHLSLTRNYYEEAPEQIEGIDSEKFNFTWYNDRLERDELFTAWYFTPDKTESLSPIFKSADTSYSYNVGDTTVAVFWAKDITIHSVYYKDDLTLHTVYWSDSTN